MRIDRLNVNTNEAVKAVTFKEEKPPVIEHKDEEVKVESVSSKGDANHEKEEPTPYDFYVEELARSMYSKRREILEDHQKLR